MTRSLLDWKKPKDKNAEAAAIIKEIYKKHNRVIFNGNNYSEEWAKEAEKRGLPNVANSVDALKAFVTDKSLKLFEKYEVLSHKEMHSRYEIYVETYAKQINIEALTAIDMVKKQFLPAGHRVCNVPRRLCRQLQFRIGFSPRPGRSPEKTKFYPRFLLQKPDEA